MKGKVVVFTLIFSLLLTTFVFAIGSGGGEIDEGGESHEFDVTAYASRESIHGEDEGPIPLFDGDRFQGMWVISKVVKGAEGNLRYRVTNTDYDVYLVGEDKPIKVKYSNLVNYNTLEGYNQIGDREEFYVSVFLSASELAGMPYSMENQILAGSMINKITFNSDIETGKVTKDGDFTNRPEYADYRHASRVMGSVTERKNDVYKFFGTREIIKWANDAGHAFRWNQNLGEDGKPLLHTKNMINWFGELEVNPIQGYNFINKGIVVDCATDKATLTVAYEELGVKYPHL